jgi:putative transposase
MQITDQGAGESDWGVGLSKSGDFELGNSKSPGEELTLAKKDYNLALRRYYLAYDKILHHSNTLGISLNNEKNRLIIEEALKFWEDKRLTSHAWCIMPNHLHWVLTVFKKDGKGNPVYLQDILHSVKLFTALRINRNENLCGQLWMHESFETTIRNERHFVSVMHYTMNNPVKAGLVKKCKDWQGTYAGESDFPSPTTSTWKVEVP